MEFSEKDWKLFRKMLPVWQERYMERLNKSYIELLNSDTQASEKFWTLEERIRQDKRSSGVIVKNIKRSRLQVIFAQLIVDGVICEEDLQSFSKELRESVCFCFEL